MDIDTESYLVTLSAPIGMYYDTAKSLSNNKRPLHAVSEGLSLSEPDSSVSNTRKKRTKRTLAQLEALQKVRAHGACLRCIFQKAEVRTSILLALG